MDLSLYQPRCIRAVCDWCVDGCEWRLYFSVWLWTAFSNTGMHRTCSYGLPEECRCADVDVKGVKNEVIMLTLSVDVTVGL